MVKEISEIKKNNKKLRFIFSRLIPIGSCSLLFVLGLVGFFSIYYPKSIVFYIFFWIVTIIYFWWLIRWFEYIILLIVWYVRYKNYQKINFNNIFNLKPKNKLEKVFCKKYLNEKFKLDDIYHWVIIPTFKDPYSMLKDAFDSIKNSDFDNKKIIITLAWEENDINNFKQIEKKFLKDYKWEFLYLNTTLHPSKLKWEISWKWSNVSFSAESIYKKILKLWIKKDNVLVSVMDSESIVQDNYFNVLTFEYCNTEDYMKDKTIYQPMLFLFNRFFSSPFFSKVIALSTTFYILAASIKWIWTRAQAVQAQSLKSLVKTNFYSKQTITEDWHQYYRTYCTFNWEFQVKPVYSHILLEPVIGKDIFESIKLQYNQIKRWAHGALDLPYMVICFFKNKMPFFRTIYEIFWLIEASVLWGSLQFILFFWSLFFFFIGWNYVSILSLFWILGFLVLIHLILITLIFLPWNDISSKRKRLFECGKYIFLSFTFMWPILLVINWLPALHAQLIILFGKPMWKFNVTKKYR